MRVLPVVITALSLAAATGCSNDPQRVAGEARPAGALSTTVPAGATAPTAPSSLTAPSPTASTPTSASARPATTSPRPATTQHSRTAGQTSAIRRTDWPNVNLMGLDLMDLGDTRFRDGTASSGANHCTMLPGGARPAYAQFLTEEPANSPATEDALILIECGSDGMQQALVPVQLGHDQARNALGTIEADTPTGPDTRMTFISYTIEQGTIVTTVRKPDGTKETRRYRFDGGTRWVRS